MKSLYARFNAYQEITRLKHSDHFVAVMQSVITQWSGEIETELETLKTRIENVRELVELDKKEKLQKKFSLRFDVPPQPFQIPIGTEKVELSNLKPDIEYEIRREGELILILIPNDAGFIHWGFSSSIEYLKTWTIKEAQP